MKIQALILAAPIFALSLSSCIRGADALPLNLGPEEDVQKVADAISKPTESMSPLNIQVGEFFAIEETQELAAGASSSVLNDTAATITAKDEDANRIIFTGVINEATYESDGTVSKVSREGNLLCVSKVTGGCGEEASQSSTAESAAGISQTQALLKKMSEAGTPEKVLKTALTTTGTKTTYHHLQTSVANVNPPARVRAQPNCLNIPNCQIKVHRVSFDQVLWENGKPNIVHIDALLSSEVPYLARNISTCYSAVANVESATGGILVKQCSNIFDFRFHD